MSPGQKRYLSVTKGENAEVLVAAAIAYTAQASFKLFEANAADGEVGIFDATTMVLQTTALAAGQKFFVSQKRDNASTILGLKGMKNTTVVIYDVNRTRRVPYIAPGKQVTTITVDLTSYTPVIAKPYASPPTEGDDFEIAIIETTPGNDPYPTFAYDSVLGDVTAGTPIITGALALQAIVNRINNTADLVHKDDGQVVTASISNSGAVYTIVLTAVYFGSHFRVALRGPLSVYGSVVYTTPFVLGTGFYDHVLSLEKEGWVYEGVTTNYPGDGVTPADFGFPTSYVVNGLTYNIYHLDPKRDSAEPNAVNVRTHYPHLYIIVPVPVGGTTTLRAASSPDLAVGTVLGFTLTP